MTKAPVHKNRVALDALQKVGFDILNHPPYSPDLAPSDYYLFPKMKKELREKKLITWCDEGIKDAVLAFFFFFDKDKAFFYEGVHKLIERSEKCIRVAGEYIEKEK